MAKNLIGKPSAPITAESGTCEKNAGHLNLKFQKFRRTEQSLISKRLQIDRHFWTQCEMLRVKSLNLIDTCSRCLRQIKNIHSTPRLDQAHTNRRVPQ